MANNHLIIKLLIETAKEDLELQYKSIESAKNLARSVLSAASLITSILGIVELSLSTPPPTLTIGLVIVLLLYVLLISLTISVLSPITVETPIEPKIKQYEKILKQDETICLQSILKVYLRTINNVKADAKHLNNNAKCSAILLGILVGIVAILTLLEYLKRI
ncbi:MAG TPA: hypothetical protein VMW28_09575 [Pelolinea sp.]|nr:hypothetical protein [Pelolinea sp.]